MRIMKIKEKMMHAITGDKSVGPTLGIYERQLMRGSYEMKARSLGLGIIKPVQCVSQIAPSYFLVPAAISPCSIADSKNCQYEVDYSWDNGKLVERHEYRTPVGKISQKLYCDQFGSKHRTEFYIKKMEDYKVLQYIIENTIFHKIGNAYQGALAHLQDDGVLYSRIDRSPYQKVLIEYVNPERFHLDLFDKPEILTELFDVIEKKLLTQLDMVLDDCSEFVWLPDNITSDLTPPYHFEEFILPYYNNIGEKIHQAGKYLVVHIDGKTSGLKDLINDSSVDVIESFSDPMIGGDLDLKEAVASWKGKSINPNFPPCLHNASENEIVEFLEKMKSDFGDESYLLQISEDIPLDSYERILPIINRVIGDSGLS